MDVASTAVTDASASTAADASTPARARILIFTKTTPGAHRHTSIEPAAAALAQSLAGRGIEAVLTADETSFDPGALDGYAGVVLVQTAGRPLDPSPAARVTALASFVRAGGGLVGIHNSTNAHVDRPEFVRLQGAVFDNHDGVEALDCSAVAEHPALARFPASLRITDELYWFKQPSDDRQELVRCKGQRATRPVSWVRQEGRGRVFYTALGHRDDTWSNALFVEGHVVPGLLWAIGREP